METNMNGLPPPPNCECCGQPAWMWGDKWAVCGSCLETKAHRHLATTQEARRVEGEGHGTGAVVTDFPLELRYSEVPVN